MAVKLYRPMTSGQRHKASASFAEITKSKPQKSLVVTKKKSGGRNSQGKIMVRHIGGGNKTKYRIIDFKRNKDGIPAKVEGIEYDPNRTAYIALLDYVDGEKRYILAPIGLNVGDTVISGDSVEVKVGNTMVIKNIPEGVEIHNIEMQAGLGGKVARSAGISARIMAKEGEYATIKMPSGETRLIKLTCRATIGQVGNLENELVKFGKAGIKRHMGIRPTVRGSAMNPVDHPHGGGEGKNPIGLPGPQSPWGQPTRGYKTRKKKNITSKFIIKRVN